MIEVRQFHSAGEVRKWLAGAKPGSTVEYHRGDSTQGLSVEAQSELMVAAGALMERDKRPRNSGPPLVFLFQRRLAPFKFAYRAMILTPVLAKKLNKVGEYK